MAQPVAVPESHRDLLERPICAVLATMLPSGFPQANVVWCGFDGTNVLVSTTAERTKGRNMAAHPLATILVIDPDDANRWIEVRGHVEITQHGAGDAVDRLTRHYTEHVHYYDGVVPAGQRQKETRVLCKITPTKVTLDAIHA